jgi:hypothetical protein
MARKFNPGLDVAHAAGNPLLALTAKQKLFVENTLRGMPQTTAARAAGYAEPGVEAVRLLKNDLIKESIAYLHRKHEKAAQMTRKQVMDGFKEAIDMAKVQAEPATMVSGWREIARMCGYYAPEKREINVNITAKRAVDQLETLSDDELLEIIEKDSEVIEGEFEEILETTQTMSDGERARYDDD